MNRGDSFRLRGTQGRKRDWLFGCFAIVALSLISTLLQAQVIRPEVPKLSLTGREGGYNSSFYPDGRLWVPAALDRDRIPRYILVPVFIKNCWVTAGGYQARPIYSIRFKFQYDSSAFRAAGILTRGPMYSGTHPNVRLVATDSATLADGWQVTWNDAVDTSYQVISGLPDTRNKYRGRRVNVVLESNTPLPLTGDPSVQSCDGFEFRPLCYIKLRVLGAPGYLESDASPLAIPPDSIYYNSLNVVKESPFPGDINYPAPPPIDRYLAGLDYDRGPTSPAIVNTIRKGMIYAHIYNPGRFDFSPKPTGDPNEIAVENVGDADTLFRITRTVYLDPIMQGQNQARVNVKVSLKPEGTRVKNVIVESNQQWLLFQGVSTGGGTFKQLNPSGPSRRATIGYIDRGILGPGGNGFPDAQEQNNPGIPDPVLNLDVICDPGSIGLDDPSIQNPNEYAGKYEGYITFSSSDAEITPVRLKVIFIYIRVPDEIYNGISTAWAPRGIEIKIRNSAQVPQQTRLLFGTGLRATINADSLFGEYAYSTPPNPAQFYARFFPINATDGSQDNGLGDYTGVFASRDIRNVFDDTTIVYRVRFSAGGPLNYPVVVTWDPRSFPDGAQLFIRDIEGGKSFSVNMREATLNADGTRSYTIRDASVTAFDIEYTPARAVKQTVNQKGWNLVSLPVRPSDDHYTVVFPRAQGGTPIKFTQELYQQEERLRVGVGYFLRFAQLDTTVISGVLIKQINSRLFPVAVYDNWNTVGALSMPTSVDNISFEPATQGGVPPSRVPLTFVYEYQTNRGYRAVSELLPGKGYWIKVRGQGYYNLISGTTKSSSSENNPERSLVHASRLTIEDAANQYAPLYITDISRLSNTEQFELPPLPPLGVFDVRFTTNTFVTTETHPAIRFQGVTYPVSLHLSNSNETYAVLDATRGIELGRLAVGKPVVISDENVNAVRLVSLTTSADYELVVTPTPVIEVATVKICVPETQSATVALYNVLGRQEVVLYDGVLTPGVTTLPLDTRSMPAGAYMLKLSTGAHTSIVPVTVVR